MRRFCLMIGVVVFGIPGVLLAGDLSAAHTVNSFGRWIGYGWSRGYHTHDNCTTPRCFSQGTILEAVPEPTALPTPAPALETLPPPKSPSVLQQPKPAKQSSRRTYLPSSGNLLKPAEVSQMQPAIAPDWRIPAEEARVRRTFGTPR